MILFGADNRPPMLDKDLVAKELWERVQLLMQGDDPIACLNKKMAFLTVVASSRFPSTNNQLRTSSSPRNQATIQDVRVTVKAIQVDRQGLLNAITIKTKDLDTYNSDCDDLSNAPSVLMANIYNYRSDVISEKRSSPQQDLSAEQAFWFCMSNPTIESSEKPPIKVEVPSELPKVSLVNASLKKIKFYLTQFDYVVKKRTTPNARTKGEWGFKNNKVIFNNDIITFLKSLKDIFNVFDKDLLNEIMEIQTVFDQMEAAVQQSSVDKQCLEIAKTELLLENDRLL
nr:hypothetical protein [Tanacetum cinerariifolium]